MILCSLLISKIEVLNFEMYIKVLFWKCDQSSIKLILILYAELTS